MPSRILSGTAFKALRDYEDQLKREVNPVFKSADIGLAQKTDFWNLEIWEAEQDNNGSM